MVSAAIGILGGTFDPVHNGHIHLAESVYRALQLKEVRLIPCNQPLLRAAPIATPAARLAMVKLALADYPFLTVDAWEIAQGGYSYSIDTLTAMRSQLPTTPLCFILGSDQFSQFTHWKQWQDIVNLVHLVVVIRPGFAMTTNAELDALLKQRQVYDIKLLQQQLSGSIFFHAMQPLAISATQVREQLQAGREVGSLIPLKVREYICENGLYK